MSQRRGSAWGCTERHKRSRRTDCKLSCAPVCLPEPSSHQHLPQVGPCRPQTGEDFRQLAVDEAQVALKNDCNRGAVVRGDGEVAALVELSRRETGPVAVHAATGRFRPAPR